MNTKISCAGLGLAVLLAGCAGPGGSISNDLTITLKGTIQNVASLGQASFSREDTKTQLNLYIGGVPTWVTRPVQLQTFIYPGTCANPGAEPAYSLNDVVSTFLTAGSTWQMTKIIPVPLETFRSGKYAVVIRTMPFDRSLDIFCGDLN